MERRKYAVRTYGCQMNEHDSERISGLLEADGLIPAVSEDEADVIVLNTCCIRENADNRLYGALGNLKTLKSERPDIQIAVGGCLAQKDRELIQQRAKHVDVVFGTHNVQNAVKLLKKSETEGPIIEILEELVAEDNEAFPSALPVRREVDHRAWITLQIGCDNTCTYCIVPSVRGPEISRPFGQLLDEAVEAVRGQLENAPAHLTVIFVSPQFKERYDEIPGMISQRMDPGCFLGCSGGGIVGGGKEVEQQAAFSMTCANLPDVEIKSIHSDTMNLPDQDTAPGVC